ncbi:MAG: hypothetical protein R3C14_28760 [Caldilineaceae bacterium]
MSKYRSFKGTERTMARRLGGKRTGHLGGQDVDAGWLSVEVKHRKALPTWLLDAISQARRHAGADQLAVVILHQHGSRHDDNLVVLRLADFETWFGNADELATADHDD